MTDFIKKSATYGLVDGEFSDLDKTTKKKLIRLMARIAEQSYRRGYQHGDLRKSVIDLDKFRFDLSLDKSHYPDAKDNEGNWIKKGFTSKERLFMECFELSSIGFSD